jgi:hypothetical protein
VKVGSPSRAFIIGGKPGTDRSSRKVRWKHGARRTTNGHRLVHQPEEESTHVRVAANNTERPGAGSAEPIWQSIGLLRSLNAGRSHTFANH